MTDPVAALVTRLRPILDQGIATFIAADGEQDEMAALDEMTHYLCTEALAFAREQMPTREEIAALCWDEDHDHGKSKYGITLRTMSAKPAENPEEWAGYQENADALLRELRTRLGGTE